MFKKTFGRLATAAVLGAGVLAGTLGGAEQARATDITIDLFLFEVTYEVCAKNPLTGLKVCQAATEV